MSSPAPTQPAPSGPAMSLRGIRREYVTQKSCAPLCTVSCVHQISYFDFFRGKQTRMEPLPEHQEHLVTIKSSKS